MDHKVIIPCPNCGKSVSNNKSSLYNNLLLICHNCGFSWYFTVQSSYNTSQGINYAAYNTTPNFTSNKDLIAKYKTTKDILRPYLNAPIHVSLRPHVPQQRSNIKSSRAEAKERENKDREYKPSGEKYTPKADVNAYLNAKPRAAVEERKVQAPAVSSAVKVISSPVSKAPKAEVKPRENIVLKKEVIKSSINTNPVAPKKEPSVAADRPRVAAEVSPRKLDEERPSRNTNTSPAPKVEREVTTKRAPFEERKRESNHQVKPAEVRSVKEAPINTNKPEIPKPSQLDSLYREKENASTFKEPKPYENIKDLYKPEKSLAQNPINLNLTAELKKDSRVNSMPNSQASIKPKNKPIMQPEFNVSNSRGISKTMALKKPTLIKKPNFSLDKDLKEPLKDAFTNILNSYEYAINFLRHYFRSLLTDTQKLLQFISYVFLGIMTLSLLILANRLKINSITDLQINSNIIKYHETKTSDLEPDYKITKSKDDDILAINNLDNAFKDEKAKKNVFLNVEKNNNVTASKVLNNPTPDIEEENNSSENMEELDNSGKVKVDNSFKGNLTSVLLKAKQVNQNFLSDLKINQKNANWIRNDNKNTLFEVTAQIENNDFKNTFRINKLQVVFTNVQGQIVYKRELAINQVIQNLSITDIQLRIKDVPFTAYNAYLFIDSKEKVN